MRLVILPFFMSPEQILGLFAEREKQCRTECRALEMWLGRLTPLRWFTVAGSTVFAAVGGAAVLTKVLGDTATMVCGGFALLASILSGLHHSLKCDVHQAECLRLINEFTSLGAAYQSGRICPPTDLAEHSKTLDSRYQEIIAKRTVLAPSGLKKEAMLENGATEI